MANSIEELLQEAEQSGQDVSKYKQAYQQNPQKYQQAFKQQSQPQGTDITELLQRIQPTMGQGIANAMSVIGGGKPIYDPNIGNEIIKNGAALKYAMAPYQQAKTQAETANQTAGASLKNTQEKYVEPKANSEVEKNQAMAAVDAQRASGMQTGNNLLEQAINGTNGQAKPNMVVSGVSTGARGGVTMKNMNELAQEGGIRAGVKGMEAQDQKVNSSTHALALFEQNYDPKTGQFNIDPSQYKELAMNIANTIASSGAGTGEDRAQIAQKTAAGDFLGVLQYVSGVPQNASTQEMLQRLYHSLSRQGLTSQGLRDQYSNSMGIAPIGSDFQGKLNNSPIPQDSQQGNQAPQLLPGQRLLRNRRTGEVKVVNG